MTKLLPKMSRQALLCVGTIATALLLTSCTVELTNVEPARELARENRPIGSVYTGWRIFQDKCASCHGPAATGTAGAPDLLPRVRTMGSRQFVSLVLKRYDWGLAPALTNSQGAEREALIDQLDQRKAYGLTMPAWQSEPSVNAHIVDVYAYLSARAQGTQGPGRPVD